MKFNNYFEVYKRIIPQGRIRILEVGVFKGDGLRWLTQNFPKATVMGMDYHIRPEALSVGCTVFAANQMSIPASVVRRMAPLDVIIDDGGHYPFQTAATFKALWPILKDGGLYIIEDTHFLRRWHCRLYGMFFGIEPIIRRMIRGQSVWLDGDVPRVCGPLQVSFYPNLIVIHKGFREIHLSNE